MIAPKTNLQSPCLCGSGRKYKNCCWPVERRARAIARNAVVNAHSEIVEYALTNHPELLNEVMDEYFRTLQKRCGAEAVHAFRNSFAEATETSAADSMVFDLRLEDGSSLVDRFLEKSGESLHPAAREYLKNCRDTACSLYEVTRVVRSSHYEVYDILSRRNLVVSDASASETLERWQLYFFRLVECHGEVIMGDLQLSIPRVYFDHVEAALHLEKKMLGRNLTWESFLKKHWNLAPRIWAEIHGRPFDTGFMLNSDDERLLLSVTSFTLLPGMRQQVVEKLKTIPGVTMKDESHFSWVENRPGSHLESVMVAWGEFSSERALELLTNSSERCERLGDSLQEHLAEYLVSVTSEQYSLDLSKRHAFSDTSAPPSEDDIGFSSEDLQDVYRLIYANWSSQPIPFLGNITPKEAVKTPQGRKKVINLLKSYEVTPSGQKVDLSFLWEEVGLKRPD